MASNGDTTKIIMEDKQDQKGNSIVAIAVIVACVVAVVALIVAVVAISKSNPVVVTTPSGNTGSGGGSTVVVQSAPAQGGGNAVAQQNGDRVWRFHIGHFGGNTQYIDTTSGQVRGYDVDVVNAVCNIAGKNCVIVWDVYENCWDSQAGQLARGGQGLMGNWYDGCIGWLQTIARRRTYEFSTPIGNAYPVGLFVKRGGSVTNYPNFAGVKVGILDGWYADEHCLVRYSNIRNFDQNDANLITHYKTEEDLVKALTSNEVDVVFSARIPDLLDESAVELYQVADFAENLCVIGGVSIMAPKANADLLAWFNPAFDRLLGTRDYDAICDDLLVAHGGMPGYDPDDYCVQ